MNIETYLWLQIQQHVALFFSERASTYLKNKKPVFVPYDKATEIRDNVVVIPTNCTLPSVPDCVNKVPFNGTHLTFWNRIPMPTDSGWTAIPESNPVWYRHDSGTLIPTWNFFGNLIKLLTLHEETANVTRDNHDRFLAAFSPRREYGLLQIPAFNEAVALLVAACSGLEETGQPYFTLKDLIRPPYVILSHDNDILFGNDFWTQSARLYRTFTPILRLKPPRLKNLWWFGYNAIAPGRYYYDNITGMIDLEQMCGFTSTFYFLNGGGGRFGARNGIRGLSSALLEIPTGWNTGIHYNYDTLLEPELLDAQIEQLTSIMGHRPISGRAHYLRFDPAKSFRFLSSAGIICDETLGYPDSIGYRCGLGGIFRPFDVSSGEVLPIYEVPLIVMDSTLIEQYPENPVGAFEELLNHMTCIGGAISVLFHPGTFFNPEFPEAIGVYRKLLDTAKKMGAKGTSAYSLVQEARKFERVD